MKTLWVVIVLLVASGAYLSFARSGAGRSGAGAETGRQAGGEAVVEEVALSAAAKGASVAAEPAPEAAGGVGAPVVREPAKGATPSVGAVAVEAAGGEGVGAAVADAPVGVPSAEGLLEDLAAAVTGVRKVEAEGRAAEASAGGVVAGGGGGVALSMEEPFTAENTTAAQAEALADGGIKLDGRYTVRGKGTKEDPYRIPWELLVSAQETYQPRKGLKMMPQRVAMLHMKYVKLEGFVAFPITSTNPRECLVMLNQWDGCCIGVPPTAYDAVEVRLRTAATPDMRFANHGTVVGRIKVEPYEDGGWVLGLYLMDDAALTVDQ